jgi:hypothetical protein
MGCGTSKQNLNAITRDSAITLDSAVPAKQSTLDERKDSEGVHLASVVFYEQSHFLLISSLLSNVGSVLAGPFMNGSAMLHGAFFKVLNTRMKKTRCACFCSQASEQMVYTQV